MPGITGNLHSVTSFLSLTETRTLHEPEPWLAGPEPVPGPGLLNRHSALMSDHLVLLTLLPHLPAQQRPHQLTLPRLLLGIGKVISPAFLAVSLGPDTCILVKENKGVRIQDNTRLAHKASCRSLSSGQWKMVTSQIEGAWIPEPAWRTYGQWDGHNQETSLQVTSMERLLWRQLLLLTLTDTFLKLSARQVGQCPWGTTWARCSCTQLEQVGSTDLPLLPGARAHQPWGPHTRFSTHSPPG